MPRKKIPKFEPDNRSKKSFGQQTKDFLEQNNIKSKEGKQYLISNNLWVVDTKNRKGKTLENWLSKTKIKYEKSLKKFL